MPATGRDDNVQGADCVRARLLGRFSLTLGARSAGPWARPSARRLCELVLVSPGKRIGREAACEALFPHLGPAAGANELRKALSMARTALSVLGDAGLIMADRAFIQAEDGRDLEVDFEAHEQALRLGLSMPPGQGRDDQLALALEEEGTLLEDEPYAQWALAPREALEALRHEARLALAMDRSRGYGRSALAGVVQAWEACFRADPSSEEAACTLIRAYSAQGRHTLSRTTYDRCRQALDEVGLRPSSALEEALSTSSPTPQANAPRQPPGLAGERRLVSVLFTEVGGRVVPGNRLGPEDVGDLISAALAEVAAEVEALGGTVSSISGAGLVALFGAPEAHEDDPERAVRAALRSVAGVGREGLFVRAGVETGQAVVGLIGRSGSHYGAIGDVVGVAAALQSGAKPASVLVGPATQSAVEGLFEWDGAEEVVVPGGGPPIAGRYLGRPRPRALSEVGRRRLPGPAPLLGRAAELAALQDALKDLVAGRGGAVVLVSEPGLGKTRLVQETRRLFMAWVGAASGRLPLWLEGRAVSYGSALPYGLYQQLLCAWLGVASEEADEVVRGALERAMKATFGRRADETQVAALLQVMGRGPGTSAPSPWRLGPEQLQRACFGAVRALVSRLMAHGPMVLTLEDLHWADPTSLKLTEAVASLTGEGPLLVVLTMRPEPDSGAAALTARLLQGAGARRRGLVLMPLAEGAQEQLARSLLGDEVADPVVKAVTEGVDGNPLFLEERLSSLLETGALVKSQDGCWRLDLGAPGRVPEALERLVRSRADRLPRGQRDAIVAASVLGPEFALGALANVTDLGGELPAAVSELVSGGLVVELPGSPEPAYRFRHALIQEALYRGLLRRQRSQIHLRTAWALETAAGGRIEEVAGLLGRHFALAGDSERAARYLELAGDRAAAAFANEEAVASYRWALECLIGNEQFVLGAVECGLKLGALFWRLGRYEEGRVALREAAELAPATAPLLAARCHRWLGQLEIEDCCDAEAWTALGAAEAILQGCPDQGSDDWVESWLGVQLCRSNLHYWRAEVEQQAAVLSSIRPLLESRARPGQKAEFRVHVAGQRWRAGRFEVDDDAVAEVTAARSMAAEAGLDVENFHWHTLGFVLLLHGDLAQATLELDGALAAARRAGDRSLELAGLAFLAWAYLRQGDVAGVKRVLDESAGLLSGTFPTSGMVTALAVWVAWKEGRVDDVEPLAEDALSRWGRCLVRYPFCWICLWPLIAVCLACERDEDAMAAARDLVSPPQMKLPARLEALVLSALSAWRLGQRGVAVARLKTALTLAGELSFV